MDHSTQPPAPPKAPAWFDVDAVVPLAVSEEIAAVAAECVAMRDQVYALSERAYHVGHEYDRIKMLDDESQVNPDGLYDILDVFSGHAVMQDAIYALVHSLETAVEGGRDRKEDAPAWYLRICEEEQ